MTRDKNNKRIGFWLMQDVGISNGTCIYHYFDIGHLCDMMDNGSLRISRKYCFEDKFEKKLLTTKKTFAFSIVGGNAPFQDTKAIQNGIDKRRMSFLKESITPTSCWSMGPRENLLMWRGYTTPNSGVCVKTTIGKFVESLYSDSYELWCGRMLYKEREQTTDISDAEWMKMPEYFGENEIRFYFKKEGTPPYQPSNINSAIHVGVNTQKMIDKIILSPYMWEDDRKRWYEYITKTYKLESKKVVKSSISLNI